MCAHSVRRFHRGSSRDFLKTSSGNRHAEAVSSRRQYAPLASTQILRIQHPLETGTSLAPAASRRRLGVRGFSVFQMAVAKTRLTIAGDVLVVVVVVVVVVMVMLTVALQTIMAAPTYSTAARY